MSGILMDGGPPATQQPITKPAGHRPVLPSRIGVLLVNLGTPDAPTAPAVRRYLAEFLSDPRIVELPRALWLPILHGIILNTRPGATARNYEKIWRQESNESPLRYFSREQATQTNQQFDDHVVIDWAMRYGTPAVADKIIALKEMGCERILVVPLYPQYSATTTVFVRCEGDA